MLGKSGTNKGSCDEQRSISEYLPSDQHPGTVSPDDVGGWKEQRQRNDGRRLGWAIQTGEMVVASEAMMVVTSSTMDDNQIKHVRGSCRRCPRVPPSLLSSAGCLSGCGTR